MGFQNFYNIKCHPLEKELKNANIYLTKLVHIRLTTFYKSKMLNLLTTNCDFSSSLTSHLKMTCFKKMTSFYNDEIWFLIGIFKLKGCGKKTQYKEHTVKLSLPLQTSPTTNIFQTTHFKKWKNWNETMS